MYKSLAAFNFGYMVTSSMYLLHQDNPVLRFAGILPILINLTIVLYHHWRR